MSRTTLVTGGAGFIGSHLVESLLRKGETVLVLDDLSTGRLENLAAVRNHPQLKITVDSILNWPVVNDMTRAVDRVIHLAAAVGVRKIMDEPVATITTNVRGTEIVLDVCHRRNLPLFIASTSEIYGKAGEGLHEDHDRVLGPTTLRRWAYACTKSLDEFLALAYHEEKDLPVVIGRFFNTVGPRQTGRWGMVLPTFVGQALRGEPLTVFGTGHQRRSLLFVGDAVRAIEGLMEREDAMGQVFNLGREEEVSILDLAKLVIHRTGSASTIKTVGYREAYGEGFEDMERRQPDARKLQAFLSWNPEKGLDEMIDLVAEDLRARL